MMILETSVAKAFNNLNQMGCLPIIKLEKNEYRDHIR